MASPTTADSGPFAKPEADYSNAIINQRPQPQPQLRIITPQLQCICGRGPGAGQHGAARLPMPVQTGQAPCVPRCLVAPKRYYTCRGNILQGNRRWRFSCPPGRHLRTTCHICAIHSSDPTWPGSWKIFSKTNVLLHMAH